MALPPLKIDVVAGGVQEATKALSSITDVVERLEKKASNIQKKGATERVKIAKDETSKRIKVEEDEVKAKERLVKHMHRIRENSATYAGRLAAKQAAEEIRAEQRKTRELEKELNKQVAARQKAFTKFNQGIGQRVGASVSSLWGGAKTLAAGALGIGGGFAIADALRYNMGAEKAAVLASNASSGTVSRSQYLDESRKVSRAYGIEQKDVIEGVGSFVAKTGDSKMAIDMADFLAKVSTSQGIDMKELSSAAGLIKAQNKDISKEQLQQMVLSAVAQGRAGAVEIGDMAGSIAKATATSSAYAGDQSTNQRKLMGLVQIGMQATGSPDEASTAVANLQKDILKNKKGFKELGIDVTDKHGRITDINEIIARAISRTKGSPEKLNGLFGDRSGRIAQALLPVYDEAEKKEKGSGRDAVIKYMKSIEDATLSTEQLDKDMSAVAETAEFKVNRAFNELRMQVGDKLVPKLLPLIDKLPQLTDCITMLVTKFVELVGWASSNPFQAAFAGVGLIVGEAIAKQILSEAVTKAITSAITTSFSGGAAGAAALGVAATAAALSLGALASTLDMLASGQAGKEADDIMRKAKAGDPQAQAALAAVTDEGTGGWGDVKRYGKALVAQAGTMLRRPGAQQWTKEIAVRQHLAEQLGYEQSDEGKAGAAYDEAARNRAAARKAAKLALTEDPSKGISVDRSAVMSLMSSPGSLIGPPTSEAMPGTKDNPFNLQLDPQHTNIAAKDFGQAAADAMRQSLINNPVDPFGIMSTPNLPTNGGTVVDSGHK